MKTLKKLKLNQLNQVELQEREMKALWGGAGSCGCGCNYEGTEGGASIYDNRDANIAGDYTSPGGNLICTKPGENPGDVVEDPDTRDN